MTKPKILIPECRFQGSATIAVLASLNPRQHPKSRPLPSPHLYSIISQLHPPSSLPSQNFRTPVFPHTRTRKYTSFVHLGSCNHALDTGSRHAGKYSLRCLHSSSIYLRYQACNRLSNKSVFADIFSFHSMH